MLQILQKEKPVEKELDHDSRLLEAAQTWAEGSVLACMVNPTHVKCAMSCHDQSLHTVAGVGFCHGLLNRHNLGLHLHVFGSQPYIL